MAGSNPNRTTSTTLLQGRVGLVTGAGSPHGIGRSIVIAAAAAGAKVIYATDLNMGNMESLALVVKQVNPSCTFVAKPFDVSSEDQTLQILKEITQQHGRFDFYFANAGFVNMQNINDVQTVHYNRAMDILTRSVYLALKYGSKAMAVTSEAKPSSRGSIVVTSSMAGLTGSYADLVYSGAKHAACGLVRAGAVNLSASNIRVNGVAPGVVQTNLRVSSKAAAAGQPFNIRMTEEESKAAFDEAVGHTRLGDHKYYYNRTNQPEEIADIAIFLASDLSVAVNGHIVRCDSGKMEGAMGESCMGPVPPVEPLF